MNSTKDLIESIIEGKDYVETFNAIMMKKVLFKLNEHKKEVAKELFVKSDEGDQINELHPDTLASYISKASHDVATKGALTRHFGEKSERDKKEGKWQDANKANAMADKIFNKSWNRRKSIEKAATNLAKKAKSNQ